VTRAAHFDNPINENAATRGSRLCFAIRAFTLRVRIKSIWHFAVIRSHTALSHPLTCAAAACALAKRVFSWLAKTPLNC
jgi:hypothetical protein